MRPHGGAPGALHGLIAVLIRQVELGPRVWREVQQLDESLGLARVAQHAEEVGDVVVQVVVDLSIGTRLLEQDTGCATKGLDVAAAHGEMLEHPRCQPELGAVIAQCGGCDLWHGRKKAREATARRAMGG